MSNHCSSARYLGLILSLALLENVLADVSITGTLGPSGSVGFPNSPGVSVNFGQDGSVYQMDGFLRVPGLNLGDGVGVSRRLDNGTPTDFAYAFSYTQPSVHQLLLDYQFINQTGSPVTGAQFHFFVDADITANTADEFGDVAGSTGGGSPALNPSHFQIGDPQLSSIFFTGLINGTLNDTNEEPNGSPGDVSMALGFTLPVIADGQAFRITVSLADDTTLIGSLALTQSDPLSTDQLTLSGVAFVPEAATWIPGLLGVLVCCVWSTRRTR